MIGPPRTSLLGERFCPIIRPAVAKDNEFFRISRVREAMHAECPGSSRRRARVAAQANRELTKNSLAVHRAGGQDGIRFGTVRRPALGDDLMARRVLALAAALATMLALPLALDAQEKP